MPNTKPNILVIDDDPVIRNLLRTILKKKYNVYAVENPSVAFKILKSEPVKIVITDYHLPEMNGLKVLEKIKNEYPGTEVIIISNSEDIQTVIGALKAGAADYFQKPFTSEQIWLSVELANRFAELNNEINNTKKKNRILKESLIAEKDDIIGISKQTQNIKEQMKLVAKTPNTSVLITGESGTGKELVARGIHALSNRSEEIFGAVNMSAVPDTLFESEFFGHKKGSFTGAITDKAGWFESVNGGTLFMDEIGEMPQSMQVKLLRVLEDRNFIKLGTHKEQTFDVRIISATNVPADKLSDGKSFRFDLFHRLSTFIIDIPPLRERKDDLKVLTEYFVKHIGKKLGKKLCSVHQDVHKLMCEYSFPGNIRELKNLVERAIILCDGCELESKHFPSILDSVNKHRPTNVDTFNNLDQYNLIELEKTTIIKALKEVNYNKAEAARLLNLEWNALYRRIQKHKISLP